MDRWIDGQIDYISTTELEKLVPVADHHGCDGLQAVNDEPGHFVEEFVG